MKASKGLSGFWSHQTAADVLALTGLVFSDVVLTWPREATIVWVSCVKIIAQGFFIVSSWRISTIFIKSVFEVRGVVSPADVTSFCSCDKLRTSKVFFLANNIS